MSYYKMDDFFKKKAEIAFRDKKDLILGDKIHYGIFASSFENAFSNSEINLGIREGWIKKSHISKENQIMSVYVWLDHDLKQRRLIPSLIEKVKLFIQEKIIGPLCRWYDFE